MNWWGNTPRGAPAKLPGALTPEACRGDARTIAPAKAWLQWPELPSLALAAAALLFFVPFFVPVQLPPISSFWSEWTAIALGLVVCLMLLHGRARIEIPAMAWGFFGLASVLALQVALGTVAFPARSGTAVGYALWAAALVMAGSRLRLRYAMVEIATALQIALVAAGFFESLIGLMQVYRIEVLTLKIGPPDLVGLLGQRNHLANLVNCGLWSLVFLVANRRVSSSTAALLALPMIMALPLSGSRSVWIYAAIACTFCILRLQNRRLLFTAGAAIAGLLLSQWLLQADSGARVAETIGPTGNTGDSRRLVLAAYAWEMFRAAPLLGVGFGEFAWRMFTFAPDVQTRFAGVMDFHSHNLVLQLLAETGLIGALCIVVPLVVWLWRLPWRKDLPSLSFAWLGMVVMFQIFHGLVEFPQWYAYFLGPLALLFGLIDPHHGCIKASPQHSNWQGWCMKVGLGCIFTAAIVSLTSTALDARALAAWQRDVAGVQQISPGQFERLLALRDTSLGWRIEPAVAVHAVPGSPAETAAALALVDHAMHAHPLPALAARQAQLLDAAGRFADAARVRAASRAIYGPIGRK